MGDCERSFGGDLPVLWRRPWWLRAGVGAGFWALLIVYGSLVPFEFDLSQVGVSLFLLSGEVSPWDDLAVNLLLYVPLGVLLRLAWGRWWTAALGVVVMSYGLESAQGLLASRVGSLQDVVLNSLGGVLGAVMGGWLHGVFRVVVFGIYLKVAKPVGAGLRWVNRVKTKPAVMLVVVALNVLLIGVWWTSAEPTVRPSHVTGMNWLPFAHHFVRSYDKAAMFLGESLLVYCVMAMLLSIGMMRRGQRWPLLGVSGVVAGVIAVLQGVRSYRGQAMADVTEPIVGVIAAGLVFTTAWLFVHAVRCSCRRKEQVAVAQDRRGRRHHYDFAIDR